MSAVDLNDRADLEQRFKVIENNVQNCHKQAKKELKEDASLGHILLNFLEFYEGQFRGGAYLTEQEDKLFGEGVLLGAAIARAFPNETGGEILREVSIVKVFKDKERAEAEVKQ